ncbi:MAG: hypothetical protein ACYCSF_11065 [Acidimicrobiales bacterium]
MSGSMPQLLGRRRARASATGLAVLRSGIGVLALVAPRLALRPWVGAAVGDEPGGRLLARSVGVRDIALGAGAILAARHDAPVRGWVEAGALADTGDLVATVMAFGKLPKLTRWGVLLLTLSAVIVGGVIAPCVDGAG